MNAKPEHISVTAPVSQAIEHVKRLLFQPFDAGRWFVIGFCAWLAHLGEGGFRGGGVNFNPGDRHRSVGRGLGEARDWVIQNLHWILPLVVVLVLVAVGLWVLFTWLSSRGRFMFLHCVALNRAEVSVPWQRFAREANSLFWFRIGLSLVGLVPTLPLVLLMIVHVVRIIDRQPRPADVIVLVLAGLALVAVGIVFLVIVKFTTDFVVPILFMRGGGCLAAWRDFMDLASANLGRFALYLLFQIVLGIVVLALIVALVLVTCCLAGCLMALPYLGTVFLLPFLVFGRSYSIHYLAQYGPEYSVFPGAEPPPHAGGADAVPPAPASPA